MDTIVTTALHADDLINPLLHRLGSCIEYLGNLRLG